MTTALRQTGPARPGRNVALRPVPPRVPLGSVAESPGARRDRRARLATALAGLVACFGLFLVIGLHVVLAQGQGELQRLQGQVEDLRERRQHLELSAAELDAPARVVAAARERLGMVPPATVVPLPPASLASPPPTTVAPAASAPAATAPPATASPPRR